MPRKLNFKHGDELLSQTIASVQSYDLAIIYPYLETIEKERLLSLIAMGKLTLMFVELSQSEQLEILELLTFNKRKELLKTLENDDLKEFVESLEEDVQPSIMALLPKIKAKTIELLMTYDEDLAASIMTTEFIAINENVSIKDATNQIVTTAKDQDYIDTLFVVDQEKRLVGVIDLRDLIVARPSQSLIDIMNQDFHYVLEYESIEKAISKVRDYDRNALPVLDKQNRIIGIITADDIFDELIESSEEDYQKLALINDHENTSSALKRSSQRLPWLLIAVVLNLIIASFLSIFEATLIEVIALAFFQPLILGMAGNIGTQSLAVTILGLHLEEMEHQKLSKRHAFKEATVGLINSTVLGVMSALVVFGFLSILNIGVQRPIEIASVVGFAVFASMYISALMGVIIPLTLNKLDIDPSVASGPIITTINDIVALVIYFGVATIAFML
ncbi:MAG: magnesium transporter [Acholeplasmataceae bacterium]